VPASGIEAIFAAAENELRFFDLQTAGPGRQIGARHCLRLNRREACENRSRSNRDQ
jgi:hypothetical protein